MGQEAESRRMSADLSTWLSEEEAASRLAISARTLRRMAAKKVGPERRLRQISGRKPEPVYNPHDVEERAAVTPHVMPAVQPTATGVITLDSLAAVLDRLVSVVETRLAPPQTPTLFVPLPEAAAYTGVSTAFLERLIRAGKLPALKDPILKIRRADLDSLDNVAELAKYGRQLTQSTEQLREVLKVRKAGGR
jgi:excisionase family DNA binding protein